MKQQSKNIIATLAVIAVLFIGTTIFYPITKTAETKMQRAQVEEKARNLYHFYENDMIRISQYSTSDQEIAPYALKEYTDLARFDADAYNKYMAENLNVFGDKLPADLPIGITVD